MAVQNTEARKKASALAAEYWLQNNLEDTIKDNTPLYDFFNMKGQKKVVDGGFELWLPIFTDDPYEMGRERGMERTDIKEYKNYGKLAWEWADFNYTFGIADTTKYDNMGKGKKSGVKEANLKGIASSLAKKMSLELKGGVDTENSLDGLSDIFTSTGSGRYAGADRDALPLLRSQSQTVNGISYTSLLLACNNLYLDAEKGKKSGRITDWFGSHLVFTTLQAGIRDGSTGMQVNVDSDKMDRNSDATSFKIMGLRFHYDPVFNGAANNQQMYGFNRKRVRLCVVKGLDWNVEPFERIPDARAEVGRIVFRGIFQTDNPKHGGVINIR